jgi:hypothetical protein
MSLRDLRGRLFGPVITLPRRPLSNSADDDLRRRQLLQALEAVVAVDHATVEVVEVGGREAATVQRDERAEIRRDDRDHLEHHPLGLVLALLEGVDDLEALGQLLALGLGAGRLHLAAQIIGQDLDVHARAARRGVRLLEQLADGLGAHAGPEVVLTVLLEHALVALLGDDLAALELLLVLRIDDDVGLAVEDLLEVLEAHVEQVADAGGQRLQEPDVGHRSGEVDVAEALAAHLRLDDLDAALLADDAAVLHALVLTAQALVVLHRPEDLGAEEPVPLRLERAVVDGLRLLDLAVRPLADLLGRGQGDPDGGERQRILGLLEENEDVLHDCSRTGWSPRSASTPKGGVTAMTSRPSAIPCSDLDATRLRSRPPPPPRCRSARPCAAD